MVEEKFDDICSNIRACLNSSKRQISINELNRDYQSVIGSYIPYKKYNCNSLEDFVKLVPNLKLSRIGNEWYVDVKLDERTKHIADFVRSQKASKPKKSKGRGGKFRSVYRGQPFRQTSWTGNSNRSYSSNKYNTNNNNNNNYKRYNTAPKRYTEEGPNYVTNKYRSTQPSALDFSDGEHDEYQEFGYDDSISDDENYSPGPPPKSAVEVQTPMENFKNLEITVNRSRSGRGFGSRGGLTRETLNRQKPKSNCLDDDIGYSSMKGDCVSSPVQCDTRIIDLTSPEDNTKQRGGASSRNLQPGNSSNTFSSEHNDHQPKVQPSFKDSRYYKNRLAILLSRCNKNHVAVPDSYEKANTGNNADYSAQCNTTSDEDKTKKRGGASSYTNNGMIDLTSPEDNMEKRGSRNLQPDNSTSSSSFEPDNDHPSVRSSFKDRRDYQTRPSVRSNEKVNSEQNGHRENDMTFKFDSLNRRDNYYGQKKLTDKSGLMITLKSDCGRRLVEMMELLSDDEDTVM